MYMNLHFVYEVKKKGNQRKINLEEGNGGITTRNVCCGLDHNL